MVVSSSQAYAPEYGDLTLGCAELEEVKLSILVSVYRGAERLYESELSYLGHRREAGSLYLLYDIYRRVDHPLNDYLLNFVAARTILLQLLWV